MELVPKSDRNRDKGILVALRITGTTVPAARGTISNRVMHREGCGGPKRTRRIRTFRKMGIEGITYASGGKSREV